VHDDAETNGQTSHAAAEGPSPLEGGGRRRSRLLCRQKGDLKELGKALTPDSSAVLLLLKDVYTEAAIDSMSGYTANVVTLTLDNELSGEIARFVAGAVSDDEGNVIAGIGGVAADAEGDVVVGADVVAATTD
jgi:hypothetical protein